MLPGSPLTPDLVRELKRYWNTDVADLPDAGRDYGSGFVKLEPLFAPAGERFLMIDADTVLSGPVLDTWRESDAPFLVDEEEQPDHEIKRLYFDWEKIAEVLPGTKRPQYVFNTGNWFGTGGLVTREDFSPLVEWSMPRKLRFPKHFMTGDQGIQNYVFNLRAAQGTLHVQRRRIMFWPVHAMDRMDAKNLASRTAPAFVVHWAGLKRHWLRDMVRSDMLEFFENYYYQRIPFGAVLRPYRAMIYALSHWLHKQRVRVRMGLQKH